MKKFNFRPVGLRLPRATKKVFIPKRSEAARSTDMLYLPTPNRDRYLDPEWSFMSFYTRAIPVEKLSYDDRLDLALGMLEFIVEQVRK